MMRNVIASFIASCLLLGVGRADDNEKTAKPAAASSDESPAKTIVYLARNTPANTLSAAVAAFLEGTDSRVTSEVTSNVLLIQTSEENQQRVIALLQQLDRAPRTLRIQMHLLKARGESLAEVDAASLTGPTGEVLKSIKSLASTGRVVVSNRIELTAVENQPTFLQFGEDIPILTATTVVPGRGTSNNYKDVSVGTIFKVTARVSGESDIVMEVDFEKSEVSVPAGDSDEARQPVPQGVSRMTHQTMSRIQNGHSLLVGTQIAQSSGGVGEAYLVLSASIDNSQHPKAMATLQSSSPKPAAKAGSGQANRTPGAEGLDRRYLAYYEKLLGKYDRNADKTLDADERSRMSKDCSEADTDKDGLVTVEELTIWSMK